MDVKAHYKALFSEHGNSAKAVQWGDDASQHNRFEILAQVAPKLGSVVDVGCGWDTSTSTFERVSRTFATRA